MMGIFEGKKVLVAEDDEINASLLVEMLKLLGATVCHVADGTNAVHQACVTDRPDILLMDCNMPGLDGWQATAEIRSHEKISGYSRLPIVAVTAAARDSDRKRCLEAGMDGYVVKPYNLERLLSAVTPLLKEIPNE